MSTKLKQGMAQGFTIIEVLIVLAIAGAILLLVFLAVPNLQRSNRNTQRKDDISRVGSTVQEFINNNNGRLPGTGGGSAAADSTTIQGQLGNLAYYQSANVTVVGPAPAATTNATDVDHVNIYTDAVCGSMAGGMGATKTGANLRSIAVVYSTEGSSSNNKNCTTF